ncbi:unnamed protein product [Dibothriocephalus latus]|uniref:Uncharacterized protein n=1 Tax=Dibothriocephalus latus TaxID=60516 RepID=A0A3P7Q1R3_DIBLA|nr:unnamed protein product [Dibothriocephalus latus]
MTARGLVHGTVDWRSSRAFFFARLSRRLLELEAVRLLRQAQNPLNTIDSVAGLMPGDRENEEEGETEMEVSERVRGSHRDRDRVSTRLWSRAADCRLRTTSECEPAAPRMPLEVLGLPRSELPSFPLSKELLTNPESHLLSDAERACYLIAQIVLIKNRQHGRPVAQGLEHSPLAGETRVRNSSVAAISVATLELTYHHLMKPKKAENLRGCGLRLSVKY